MIELRPAASPRRWTLRTRLVVTQLGLTAAVSAVIGLVSVLSLNQFLVDRLDGQLRSASYRGLNVYDNGGPPNPSGGTGQEAGPPPLPPGGGIGTLSARIAAGSSQASGRVSTESNPTPGQSLTDTEDSAVARAARLSLQEHRTEVADLGDSLGPYLVIASVAPDGDVLVTGLPLRDVYDTTVRLALVITVVALIGMAAVGLAGTAIVRLTLRPLRRVAATARRVAQLPLDRGEVALAVRVPEAAADDRTEVGQVGHALNRMLEHVAWALQARQESEMRVRQFLSDASHELRTPLASIRGYAELTRRNRWQVPPDVAYSLERVESEAQRMTDLVEELLLLARLDEGRPLDRAPVDLSELVVAAVSDAHVAGPDHHWQLDLPEEPITVVGDRDRLHQVVANLLTNARTHTPAGTTVQVSLSPGADAAEVRVADTGPGIPEDLQPEIFERFARADTSRSRAAGGTGLGLAIVQAVVRAHGGQIHLTSRPGETVFTVQLPMNGLQH
jgi:two-component system OmpR family sensor kinase